MHVESYTADMSQLSITLLFRLFFVNYKDFPMKEKI